jgi:hypothetical protein
MARRRHSSDDLGPLAQDAIAYARTHPRRNPPEPGDLDELVNGFCVTKKMQGEDMSDYDEEQWREAFLAMGVDENELASYMEDVASWGVDD